jgi:hypothetical protein
VPGRSDDNPRLLSQVTAANLALEVLVHEKLEPGLSYQLGVHAYDLDPSEPVTASLNVFFDDVRLLPRQTRVFDSDDTFWLVRSVTDAGQLTMIDQTTRGFPE